MRLSREVVLSSFILVADLTPPQHDTPSRTNPLVATRIR